MISTIKTYDIEKKMSKINMDTDTMSPVHRVISIVPPGTVDEKSTKHKQQQKSKKILYFKSEYVYNRVGKQINLNSTRRTLRHNDQNVLAKFTNLLTNKKYFQPLIKNRVFQ